MRIEFCPKTKSTLVDITVLSLKMGQHDTKPALCVNFKTPMPNTVLNALDKRLRTVFYEKNGNAAKTQQHLEGIEQVTDLPQLTELGGKLGPIQWPDEQTGSKLLIYHGIGARPAWTLKDGTVRKVKCDAKEGGTVDVHWQFYTADVDAETIGELAVLKSHEVDLELTPPEIVSQAQIEDGLDDDAPAGDELTPEKALATALQQQHEGKEVTAKPPARKKTPLAKKIARAAGKQSRRAKA
jgi:hypothetical protein